MVPKKGMRACATRAVDATRRASCSPPPSSLSRSCDAPRSYAMSTQALYNQISAKWNNSFNRLNRGEPGISGLLSFSQVRHPRDLSGRATLINYT